MLIVGGGPAGLATAIAARRHGLSVLVADGAIPPIDKACGEGLLRDGVEALRDLGIDLPESAAYPFRGIRFVSEGVDAQARFRRGSALGIRRTHLHRAMLDRAAACGVRMIWQATVTGLDPAGALVAGELVRARFVVGADGTSSRLRQWAGLVRADRHSSVIRFTPEEKTRRFAFRQHYRIAPWSEFMELHWGRHCQAYVTPVGREEVCVALVSSSAKSRLRTKNALAEFPELKHRLADAVHTSTERGAITITRRLRRVYSGRTVLVGDASGAVDAITGDGLSLTFRQAALLAESLASGELDRYQRGHRQLLRRPALMARTMLFLAEHGRFRQAAMRAFRFSPQLFARLLDLHVGRPSPQSHISNVGRTELEVTSG